jgi:1,4-alpha-glucan branching enzyme
VNPETEHFWRELASVERQAWEALAQTSGHDGFRSAQAHELLLALASDWPFLVTTQAARDYAERRFALHVQRLRQLITEAGGPLPPWVAEDAAFPDGLLLSVVGEVVSHPTL